MEPDKERTAEEVWEAWAQGKSRCPYCINVDDEEFSVICDCSRYEFEQSGQQIHIGVVGTDISVPVFPIQTEDNNGR